MPSVRPSAPSPADRGVPATAGVPVRASAPASRRALLVVLGLAAMACVILAAATGPARATAATHRAPAPLRAPSVSVRLLTADPVAVLQQGRFAVRVTARHTASVRLAAYSGSAAIAPARTSRFRARTKRSRTFALPLSQAARRQLSSCAAARITVVVRARGYGSRGLRTGRHTKLVRRRFTFVCRGGKLVPAGPADAGTGRPDDGTRPASTTAPGGSSSGAPGAAGRSYEVGMGARSIAPEAAGTWKGKPVYLGGYGFGGGATAPGASSVAGGRPATGVLGEGPSVRAFVVGDGKTTSAVADMEVQGWFAERRSDANGIIDMRKAIAAATGGALPATRVVIQSDHTHSGADAMGVWGGVPADFIAYMRRQTEASILTAWFNRRPGRLFYGWAEGKDLLTNQFSYDEANKTQDSEVRVLQARTPEGTPFATLLNFSAHSTVLGADNTLISGDWEQRANRIMAARTGADGKPLFGEAMTMIGTFGRTQPNRANSCTGAKAGSSADGLCKLDDYAGKVVDRAVEALGRAAPITGAPVVGGSSYLVEDPSTNAPILGFSTLGPTGAPVGLPFDRSAQPPWQTGNVIGTVTGTLRVGDVLLSSVPGEIYPQIALAVSSTVKDVRPHGFMTAGLADDQLGYIIAPYEAYPAPVQASFVSANAGDEVLGCAAGPSPGTCSGVVTPLGNDNYFFNVSHTLGERVTCSLLRGADDLFATGYRAASPRCAPFATDLALAPGADVTTSDQVPHVPVP